MRRGRALILRDICELSGGNDEDKDGVMLMAVVVAIMITMMLPFKRTPSSQYRSLQLPC
jgi:hypothetical protein